MSHGVSARLWAWSGLGLAGSLITALAAPRALHDPIVGWWYRPGFGSDGLVWVGVGLLALGWLGVVRDARRDPGVLAVRRAGLVALVWAIPLALAPPLFSRDVYSYLAQGTLLHLGVDPYRTAPAALAGLGRGHTLAAVSPFWRGTTAPYGPLFLELISFIVGLTGEHLVAGVLLCRVLDLLGLALLAVSLERIARALGADGGRAVWLATASPLALLGLVAAGHNDALMAGLLAAGVAAALRGQPLFGVALCALAATIKVPALVGAVFIAVCWARAERTPAARARLLGAAAGIVAAVLGLVTVASGVGLGWLSDTVFATPAKVHLAITPATAVGYTAAALLHDAGIAVSAHHLESVLGLVGTALAALLGLRLLWCARVPTLVPALGVTLVLAAVGGPAAWPWYLVWGLGLLVASPRAQRSPALVATLVLGGVLVAPNGILVLPGSAAPAVLAVYAGLGLLALWWWWRRRRAGRPASAADSRPAALAST